MTETEEASEDDRSGFSLASFFRRNSSLFTVLGVFGAISVYFTRLEIAKQWSRLGLVSSLAIFLLVAFNIYRGFVPERSHRTPFDFLIQPRRDRIRLTLFAVPFFGIIASVLALVVSYMGTITFLSQFVFVIFGMSTVVKLVDLLNFPEGFSPEIGRDPETILLSAYILRNSAYALIIGLGYLAIAWVNGWVTLESLKLLKSSSLLHSITAGYATGLATGGALYVFFSLSLILVHRAFKGMRERGELEEFGKFYNRWIRSGTHEED